MITTRILLLEKNIEDADRVVGMLSVFGFKNDDFLRVDDEHELYNEYIQCFGPEIIFATIDCSDVHHLLLTFSKIQQAYPQLPVVIFSDSNNDESFIKFAELGTHGFFVKGTFTASQLYRFTMLEMERHQLKQQLKTLKLQYQNIFLENEMPMIVANQATDKILAVNPSAAALYNYSPIDFYKLHLNDLTKGKSVEDSRYLEAYHKQTSCHYKSDGELMYVKLTESPISYNEKPSVLIAVNDVTANILSALEEHKTNQRLDAIINCSHDMILLINEHGRIVQTNSMACDAFKYSSEEMCTMHINDICLAESTDKAPKLWKSFLENELQSGLIKMRKKGGESLTCKYNATASILQDLHLFSFKDVTENEVNDNKIQEQALSIEHILNNISECFFTIDKSWNITYWNKSAEKVIGLKKEALLGKCLWDCFPERKKLVYYPYYEQVMNSGVSVHFEEFYTPLKMWVNVSAYATKDGVAIFFTDITTTKKYAEELQEARNNQAALINSSRNLIWAVDTEMKLLSFNNAYSERIKSLTGQPAVEGLQLPGSFHTTDTAEIWRGYYQHALLGNAYTIETLIADAKDGEVKMAEVNFYPFYAVNSDKIKGVACYSHDITQREEARKLIEVQNQLLKENEENLERITSKLEKVMNSSLDVICSIDKGGKFLQVSKASFYMWGYEPEELVGQKVLKFVSPQLVDATHQAALNVINGAEYTDFQNVFLQKNGEPVPLLWSARWDKDEAIMFCVARDASAMIETERLKAVTEQRISALVQKGADIICILSQTGNYQYISDNVKSIFGYEPESLLGTNVLSLIHPDDVAIAINALQLIGDKEEIKLEPVRYKSLNNEWLWVETIATNQLHNPAIKGIVISSRDITNRKKIEAERELMIKELLKSNADLKQFSFITSHNLRAPLSNIVGILNIIEYNQLDDYNRNLLTLLDTSVKQLSQTIDDLSKILIVKNNVNIDIASINLVETLNQVRGVFLNSLNDVCANVVTDFKVNEIRFNYTYFESILVNLVSNAIKYRSLNRDLTIVVNSQYDQNGNVVLTFTDNGIGIDLTRHQDKVFGLYQRFHDHTEGHGLGLFIIKSQIVALGGKIDIHSQVDKGTTFTITFKNESDN